ncbi:MAG: permease-like cell division protein FtsX [Niabella sp.]
MKLLNLPTLGQTASCCIKKVKVFMAAKQVNKRGKPSYFMPILGVTLVLFLVGIIGWLIINTRTLGQHFKENIEINVYLRDPLKPADSAALVQYISSKPYVKEYTFTTKEMAKKKYIADGNEDWGNVLTENPLPSSIDFKLKPDYVQPDSMKAIKADLEQQTYVTDVQYQQELVSQLNRNINRISAVLLGIAVLLSLVVIFLIDNTIRLAMFSSRFTIKTMQMVGATRWFIAKPMDMRAILNGAISGVIAIIAVCLTIYFTERILPELKAIRNPGGLAILFVAMFVLGILITLVSTHSSVMKYLRKKLDDLY